MSITGKSFPPQLITRCSAPQLITRCSPTQLIPRCSPTQLILRTLSARRTRGWLEYGHFRWPCALGRFGSRAIKREGDGATPGGIFEVRRVYYRPDRQRRFASALPSIPLRADMGWCDDPADGNYNRPVPWPYAASAEKLWRPDHLYDLIVVLSHNEQPRVRGGGSAIFMHVARPGYLPTQGCIALRPEHLRRLLMTVRRGVKVRIAPS